MPEIYPAQLYLIRQKEGGSVEAEQIGSAELRRRYASLVPVELEGRPYALGYSPDSGDLDAFAIGLRPPGIEKAGFHLNVGPGLDIIEPFVIGNQPHLICYTAKTGTFDLFSIGGGPSLSTPYRFVYSRGPATTVGFTTAKPFISSGQVGVMGYNSGDGHVAIYTVSVTATSSQNVPPLKMSHLWAHQWSRGWTRFAFFHFGGAVFFLKTNVVTPNVNIDHVLDGMSGAVRVGTHLDLAGALRLSDVQAFDLKGGDPWFVTYEKTGETTLNRIHGGCQGWTQACSFRATQGAGHAIPLSLGGETALLVA